MMIQARANSGPGCGFCRRNRESTAMIMSHRLRDNRGRVLCPQLRRYRCPGCGATGDDAHTRSYCPNVVSARRQYEQRTRSPSSSNSAGSLSPSSPNNSAAISQLADPSGPAANQPELVLELGRNRSFHNMARVTNSRFNSAGQLRHRSRNNSASDHTNSPASSSNSSGSSMWPINRPNELAIGQSNWQPHSSSATSYFNHRLQHSTHSHAVHQIQMDTESTNDGNLGNFFDDVPMDFMEPNGF